MKTPHQIIDFIGKERLAGAVGVKPGAVERALRKGALPSLWYHACCLMTHEATGGVPLPRECFSFKGLDK